MPAWTQGKTVTCDIHGESGPALVCAHIIATLKGSCAGPVGFIEPDWSDSPDMPELAAWCFDCDRELLAAGRWTDAMHAYADVQMICERCFDAARKLNDIGLPPAAALL